MKEKIFTFLEMIAHGRWYGVDYIHVMDLAEGHISALKYLFTKNGGLNINLGT